MPSLLLALIVCAQDRSTPEKTFQSYVEIVTNLQKEFLPKLQVDLEDEVEKLGDFCRTDAFKAAEEARRAESKTFVTEAASQDRRYESKGPSDNPDGSVSLRFSETYKTKTVDATGKETDKEHTSAARLVLDKVGADWLIREIYRTCFMCDATGQCSNCKGTGESFGQSCVVCKGKKLCPDCDGKKERADRMDQIGFIFVVADADPKDGRDLSTAASAAQAYADFCARRELVRSAKIQEIMKKAVDGMRTVFKPDVMKTIDEALAKEVELGRKRFKDGLPKVGPVQETGDTATAVLETPAGWRDKQVYKQMIVLVKAGAEWRVNEIRDPCYACAGAGTCGACSGTGKFDDKTACYACEGKKACGSCAGSGFMK